MAKHHTVICLLPVTLQPTEKGETIRKQKTSRTLGFSWVVIKLFPKVEKRKRMIITIMTYVYVYIHM